MSNLSCFALLLVAVVCCTLGSSSKTIVNTDHQATKPANLPNRVGAAAAVAQEKHQQQQQYSFKAAQARQKRSQRDLDVYDEYFRDMSPHAYNQALQTILQHLQTQLQRLESVKMRPRLGRSPALMKRQLLDDMIDASAGAGADEAADDDAAGAELLDDIGVPFQLSKRGIKKSVPFKPRLGKRVQTCN